MGARERSQQMALGAAETCPILRYWAAQRKNFRLPSAATERVAVPLAPISATCTADHAAFVPTLSLRSSRWVDPGWPWSVRTIGVVG